MYTEDGIYPIDGYRVIVTEDLFAVISGDYLPTLEGFVSNMNSRLNAFCLSVKGYEIKDLDFDTLVLETFQVFYAALLGTTHSDKARIAVDTFTSCLTLNYVMLSLADSIGRPSNVLQLVLDRTPESQESMPDQDFSMWRSIHERSLNLLH